MSTQSIIFNPGLHTPAALVEMATKAHETRSHYAGVSAAHYTAWDRLVAALEAAAESIGRPKPEPVACAGYWIAKSVNGAREVVQLVEGPPGEFGVLLYGYGPPDDLEDWTLISRVDVDGR